MKRLLEVLTAGAAISAVFALLVGRVLRRNRKRYERLWREEMGE